MAEDPDNHTLRLLREMREEQRRQHADLVEHVADLRTRIDGNTPILNFIACVVSDHEKRIEALEETENS